MKRIHSGTGLYGSKLFDTRELMEPARERLGGRMLTPDLRQVEWST